MARQQYIDYGYEEKNRTVQVPVWDEIWWCGETFGAEVECGCEGTLHYGPAMDMNGGYLDTLDHMRDYKTY